MIYRFALVAASLIGLAGALPSMAHAEGFGDRWRGIATTFTRTGAISPRMKHGCAMTSGPATGLRSAAILKICAPIAATSPMTPATCIGISPTAGIMSAAGTTNAEPSAVNPP